MYPQYFIITCNVHFLNNNVIFLDERCMCSLYNRGQNGYFISKHLKPQPNPSLPPFFLLKCCCWSPNYSRSESILWSENCKKMAMIQHFSKIFSYFLSSHPFHWKFHILKSWVDALGFLKKLDFFSQISSKISSKFLQNFPKFSETLKQKPNLKTKA